MTYDRLKDSHAFEMAGQAAYDIEGCIKKIRTDCPKTASFNTKENALETLRKIGKSICLSNGIMGHEIRKNYCCGTALVSTLLHIAGSLTLEEKARLRPWCDEKLVELQGIADAYCIFEDLAKVIDVWGGEEEEEHEGRSDSSVEVESPSPSADEEEVEG